MQASTDISEIPTRQGLMSCPMTTQKGASEVEDRFPKQHWQGALLHLPEASSLAGLIQACWQHPGSGHLQNMPPLRRRIYLRPQTTRNADHAILRDN